MARGWEQTYLIMWSAHWITCLKWGRGYNATYQQTVTREAGVLLVSRGLNMQGLVSKCGSAYSIRLLLFVFMFSETFQGQPGDRGPQGMRGDSGLDGRPVSVFFWTYVKKQFHHLKQFKINHRWGHSNRPWAAFRTSYLPSLLVISVQRQYPRNITLEAVVLHLLKLVVSYIFTSNISFTKSNRNNNIITRFKCNITV